MESDEAKKDYLSINQFLERCSFAFKYNYAGARENGGIGRGKFHTTLEAMRDKEEWGGHHKDAEHGNVILYSTTMLEAAKNAVEVK